MRHLAFLLPYAHIENTIGYIFNMREITFFAKIFLVIFVFFVSITLYRGIIVSPAEGDSVDYHIPIAKSFLTGDIITGVNISAPRYTRFYPANAEGLLSLFIAANIPLGLYNVLGIIVLFCLSLIIGRIFCLSVDESIIFAVTISLLNGVMRWADTQIIDIWIVNFLLLTIIILEKLSTSVNSYLSLGLSIGFLLGMKFNTPFIIIGVISVYWKKIFKNCSITKLIVFVIPIILLGLIWYIRNYIYVGNPFYPQKFLSFPGDVTTVASTSVFKVITHSLDGLLGTLNAFISEIQLFAFVILFTVSVSYFKKDNLREKKLPYRLLAMSFPIIIIGLFLPSSYTVENIMISSVRYFMSACVLLILFCFVVFKHLNKMRYITITALLGILSIEFPYGYFPKLQGLILPIGLLTYSFGYKILVDYLKKVKS